MIDKLVAQKRIFDLVTRFEEQYSSYTSSGYNETQTRRDFIDPFFKDLGWDIDNEEGYAEAYREVIHEDKVKVSGATKAPDYSFRLVGGKRLFFVEAKKPSVSVRDDIHPAYQIRRYGWSAKHPISIITDFAEFAIYDCTKKPNPTDKPSVARIKYFTYKDYLKEFDFIWETFSKEQVLKGSFDKFVQSDTHKKGTASVDKDFLESLDRWRTYLAVNISWNNKELEEDEINFAVQQTIDRIIFLRIAEDRGVEPYGNLKHTLEQGNLYSNLFEQFRKADEKYNSGLFDLKKDRISETLNIEDKVIKTIINELYYPECPYEFSVLPLEILGSAYEQFLGKVIRITPAHHAKIEDKPEVRKAGGVYYTPQYIVDYIVKNTVGKLIEGKTPNEISKIKIVDPACGSGSFLIGAFQYLLDYHKNYYSNSGKPSKGKKDNPLTPDGHLTTSEKKKILLNNIFGVDLDINAVEVTKLSLLLKCMEGETDASIAQQFKLWNERVLPTLDDNIKDGNSVIDTDFYDSQLDFGDDKKIKPFNWEKRFVEIFAEGGFDIVIGNPPYVRSKLIEDTERDYFTNKFKSTIGTFDLYSIFLEKSFQLLKSEGVVAFINPNKYFYADYGEGIRKVITDSHSIIGIVDFNEFQVFEGITTYTTINIFSKKKKGSSFIYTSFNSKKIERSFVKNYLYTGIANSNISEIKVLEKNLNNSSWLFKSEVDTAFIDRIKKTSIPLIKICYKIYQGFVLTPTEVFPVSVVAEHKNYYQIKPIKQDETEYRIEKALLVPIIKSSSIFRYCFESRNYFSVFPYKYLNEREVELIPEKILIAKYPKTYNYLISKSKFLKSREKGKWKESPTWYEFSRRQNFECQKMEKILVPGLATYARYSLADSSTFIDQGSYGIILNAKTKSFEKFILGLLNSNLLDYILKSSSGTLSGGYYSYQTKYLSSLPIKLPNLKDNKEKQIHDEIITFVDQLIILNRELRESQLQTKTNQINSKIDYCQYKMDEIIYQLYGLTEEEIKTIEKK